MEFLKSETVSCRYGSAETIADMFVVHDIDDCGGKWYVRSGCKIVNYTTDDIYNGIDESSISDIDCFTWKYDVESVADLVEAVEYE